MTRASHTATSGRRQPCAVGRAGAHLGSSSSRTCCALEKAGWRTVKVQMRGMFPPGRVCSVDFFRPPSVPCCRARILHASVRCNVKSASYWVGQGGTSSQRHQHESPGELRSGAPPGTASPSGTCARGGTGVPRLNVVLALKVPLRFGGGGGGVYCCYLPGMCQLRKT